MELGAFSISLAVKDLGASQEFYQKLGFSVFHENILTFNPGWDSSARPIANYSDVREIQRRLRAEGVQLLSEADEASTGPASCMVMDPDAPGTPS